MVFSVKLGMMKMYQNVYIQNVYIVDINLRRVGSLQHTENNR